MKFAVAREMVVAKSIEVIPLRAEHYPQVARIYKEGLDTGIASFETDVPDWNSWNEKFLEECRFVVIADEKVVGWCALSPVSKREVYKGVAEVTIYVTEQYRGRGIGRNLLHHLVESSENLGFWTLCAAMFPQNKASFDLHKKCGFRFVGRREKIARRGETWYDNIIMERRSKNIL